MQSGDGLFRVVSLVVLNYKFKHFAVDAAVLVDFVYGEFCAVKAGFAPAGTDAGEQEDGVEFRPGRLLQRLFSLHQ